MGVLRRLSKEEIKKDFKYMALAYGCVPVYFSDVDDSYPLVATRNWVPEWTLDFAAYAYSLVMDVMDPYEFNDHSSPFTITGKIK